MTPQVILTFTLMTLLGIHLTRLWRRKRNGIEPTEKIALYTAVILSCLSLIDICWATLLPPHVCYVSTAVCLALLSPYQNIKSVLSWPFGEIARLFHGQVMDSVERPAKRDHHDGGPVGESRDQRSPTVHDQSLYSPLEEGQIRLLEFCTDDGDVENPLRFKLFRTKLSQRPAYTALSYSWGDTNEVDHVSILVNGQDHKISHNLADALRNMRREKILVLWVDAISINQHDTVEKSKEVTRMFAIYRMATMVAIWIGVDVGPEDDTERLINMIHEFERPHGTRDDVHTLFGASQDALGRLLSNPYWSRVWIIQEVAAARHARVFWGSYQLELRSLEALLDEQSAPVGPSNAEPVLAQKVLSIRAACRAQQKPRLIDVLAMTTASKTSHLRDKVYGLLGLASDWSDFIQEPDYADNISENSLSLEMTSNYINWYTSAEIIFLRSAHPHQSTLPSWCPDYFHFQAHESDHNLISYICGKNVNLGWEKRRAFGASASMNKVIPDTFRITGNKLSLKGNRIGRISALGTVDGADQKYSFQSDLSPPAASIPDVGKALRRLLLICHNQTFGHLSGEGLFTLLYALPHDVFTDRGCTNVTEWLQSQVAFLQMLGVDLSAPPSDPVRAPAVRLTGGRTVFWVRPEWEEYFRLDQNTSSRARNRRMEHPVDLVLKSISSILEERLRLMCIGDGALLGWAHRDAAIGDVVWHLEGCTLQAILRRSQVLSEEAGEDIYELVGHAYVDPVMASGKWIAREHKSRLVHIC